MSVTWGCLSTARISDLVLSACERSSLVTFKAVASRNRSRANAVAAAYDIERAYGTYDALLQDPDIDAVYICLPNALHVEWSLRALEAGKHVLCEKPLGRRASDVERAFGVAQRAELLLAEAFMYRHHPQTRRLVDSIAKGLIGHVMYVRATLSFRLDDEVGSSDPRLDSSLDGGALMDVGCYCVNAIRMLAGEPHTVYGEQATDGAPVDMRFMGMLRFASGTMAQFDCGMMLPRRDYLEVVGSEGTAVLADPWHCRQEAFEIHHGGGLDDLHVTQVQVDPDGRAKLRFDLLDVYRMEFESVSRSIMDGDVQSGADDAIEQARIMEALYSSAERGEQVRLASVRTQT